MNMTTTIVSIVSELKDGQRVLVGVQNTGPDTVEVAVDDQRVILSPGAFTEMRSLGGYARPYLRAVTFRVVE